MLLSDIVKLNGNKMAGRPAVVTAERTVTFGELRAAAWRVANAMREIAGPGDRIAILAENLPEYVECYYGVPAAMPPHGCFTRAERRASRKERCSPIETSRPP